MLITPAPDQSLLFTVVQATHSASVDQQSPVPIMGESGLPNQGMPGHSGMAMTELFGPSSNDPFLMHLEITANHCTYEYRPVSACCVNAGNVRMRNAAHVQRSLER
jgi:hypothetical protein